MYPKPGGGITFQLLSFIDIGDIEDLEGGLKQAFVFTAAQNNSRL